MENINVKNGMNTKEIKTMLKEMLLENEVVVYSCLVDNSAAATARIGVGIFCGIGITFNDYATQYKVIATNKRLILFGISNTVNLVTEAKIIEYNEISSLTTNKDMSVIRIKLNNNNSFELAPLDFSDDKEIKEKSIKTFNYIISNIPSENVTIKTNAFASNLIFTAVYSAIIVILLLPFLIGEFIL